MSCASVPPRRASSCSAAADPLEATSWLIAFLSVLLIVSSSARVSVWLRSIMWGWMSMAESDTPLSYIPATTVRMNLISPRVCWNPGFSRNRA